MDAKQDLSEPHSLSELVQQISSEERHDFRNRFNGLALNLHLVAKRLELANDRDNLAAVQQALKRLEEIQSLLFS